MNFLHHPVLNKEVIGVFEGTEKKCFVDCTVGMGGHSYLILSHFKNAEVVAIDMDLESIDKAKENLRQFGDRISFYHMNFVDIFERIPLPSQQISGVLIDSGISTVQLTAEDRGFSHRIDAPLDMRKNRLEGPTARDVINTFKEDELEKILREFGDVGNSRKLAKKIIEKRLFQPINTTGELTEIVSKTSGWRPRKGKLHPAAKVFQALRIFLNNELEGIESFLKKIPTLVKKGTRIAFIAFHSVEDRLVKQTYLNLRNNSVARIIKPFPMVPSNEEMAQHPPSRPARLRALEIL